MSGKIDPTPDTYIKIGEHVIASGVMAGVIMLVAIGIIFGAGILVGRLS